MICKVHIWVLNIHRMKFKNELDKIGAVYKIKDEEDLLNQTADDLSIGEAIGWFQGRMEFGPRALGKQINFRRSKIFRDAKKSKFKS